MLYDSKIRAFLAVTEEGSFTAAARKLGVVRGAALQLTPAGETFRDYARRIQQAYDLANQAFGL